MKLIELWRAHEGRCWYCDRTTWVEGTMSKAQARLVFCHPSTPIAEQRTIIRHRRATREHLIRRADGGIRTPGNIVLACNYCNSTRGVIPPDAWRIIRRGGPYFD